MLILRALSLGPLHGYGIIQRIRQLSDELLEVEQGSLYQGGLPNRAARMDQLQVGDDRDRPSGQVLHTDKSRE
jgi:PadR family transcriptional regulator